MRAFSRDGGDLVGGRLPGKRRIRADFGGDRAHRFFRIAGDEDDSRNALAAQRRNGRRRFGPGRVLQQKGGGGRAIHP